MASGKKHTILGILPSAGGGDWPPLMALAGHLQNRGHKLHMLCDNTTAAEASSLGCDISLLPESLPLQHFTVPALSYHLAAPGTLDKNSRNPFTEWCGNVLPKIEKCLHGLKASCIIGSLFGFPLAAKLARRFNSAAVFLNPSFSFDESSFAEPASDFSFLAARMYRYWLYPSIEKADMMIHATDPLFDNFGKERSLDTIYCGPLFWEKDSPTPSELEEEGPQWVLVSLSTSAQEGDILLARSSLSALKHMPFRVLLTLSPDHDPNELGPEAANIRICGYTPHSRILPHCSLVISHAGHGLVLKSMVHSVPMILVPWGRDQPGVAARAATLGIAEVIRKEDCSHDSLAAAVTRVSSTKKLRTSATAHAHRSKMLNLIAEACGKIERISG